MGEVGFSKSREAILPSAEQITEMAENSRGGFSGAGATASPGGMAVIDLTDIQKAADGDPVQLGYFSAIQERIQQTANDGSWLPETAGDSGVVYVAFTLTASGDVESVSIVGERSVPSHVLQSIAEGI